MTNEEAIEYGNKWLQVNIDCECSRKIWIDRNTYEFFQTAVKALEQQPCEDSISRQVVLDKIKEVCFSKEQKWVDFRVSQGSNGERDFIINFIESLPSAQPKEKTGHWIEHDWKEFLGEGYYRCSVCNHGYQRYTKVIRKSDIPYIDGQECILRNVDNYCPNCGARMVSK